MKKIFFNLLVFTILISPTLLFAQTQNIGLQNPIKVDSISALILIVTRVVRYIAIPFIVIAIMWAGFQYIIASAQGKVTVKEHKNLGYVILGAFILLSSELIALVMKNTLDGLTK